jgi:SAM-dependent methyltransferase
MGSQLDAASVRQEVQRVVDRILAGVDPLRVLEAGCGSMNHLSFPESSHVTGIDISRRQLERNCRLDERIVGDLQTCTLPADSFDAVVCWNVLEHLRCPERAVRRLAAAVRPGGVLVLACPDPRSLRGMAARLTPHWFHVWFYKTVLGVEGAGKDEVGPFPTFMSSRIAPAALCRLADSCGLVQELKLMVKDDWWWGKNTIVQRMVESSLDRLSWVLRMLTLGRYEGELAQTRLVFRKTAPTL